MHKTVEIQKYNTLKLPRPVKSPFNYLVFAANLLSFVVIRKHQSYIGLSTYMFKPSTIKIHNYLLK